MQAQHRKQLAKEADEASWEGPGGFGGVGQGTGQWVSVGEAGGMDNLDLALNDIPALGEIHLRLPTQTALTWYYYSTVPRWLRCFSRLWQVLHQMITCSAKPSWMYLPGQLESVEHCSQ